MGVTIERIDAGRLGEYARVSIVYQVRSVFRVDQVNAGLGGISLREESLTSPAGAKDYDALGDGGPSDWPRQFDTSQWGIFLACDAGVPVGGAAVAWNTAAVHMLEGRQDLAVLWDIRVCPNRRGQGIGAELFRTATQWARTKGCAFLKVETQNVNVPACRFYAAMDCFLGQIDRLAYRGRPVVADEVMLVWYLNLSKSQLHPRGS